MRKLVQNLGAAKINMLEKIGKRDTTETVEMQTEIRKVEEMRHGLKEIYKHIDKGIKTSSDNVTAWKETAEVYKEVGNNLANNGEHPTLAGMFLKLSDVQESIEELNTRLDFLLALRLGEPLKDFVKGDIKDARLQKKKFDAIRLSYESAQESLKKEQQKNNSKTNPKLQELQDECDALKIQYEKGEFETISKLKDCNRKSDFELLERCCDYVDAYYDFFSKGHQSMSELMPRVEKYREQIQQAKVQFQVQQEERKQNLDETGKIKPRYFGVDIAEVCKKENCVVPLIVQKTVDHLNKQSLEVEGIFRISGSISTVNELRRQFEEGKIPDLTKVDDIHAVSGILKAYLRELPTPILTHELYGQFQEASLIQDHVERTEKIRPLVQQLSTPNQDTLSYVLQLCYNLTQYAEKNRMTASNLATVLGPNLMYNQNPNPLTMKQEIESTNSIVETMIIQYPVLFGGNSTPRGNTTPRPPPKWKKEENRNRSTSSEQPFFGWAKGTIRPSNSKPEEETNKELPQETPQT